MADRFMVDDYVKWGKLVKSWATGKNYVDPPKAALPLPRTLAELKDQCDSIGLVVQIPASLTGVAMMQYSPDILIVKLPPKSLVEAVEAEIGQGAAYQIPRVYDEFYGRYGAPLRLPDQATKMEFHAARIGEYSINHCG